MRSLIISSALLIGLFSLPIETSNAQDLYRSGSTYSYYGLGMPNDYRAPNAAGMNVIGTSVYDMRISSTANPAILGTNRYTNINGGFNVTGYEMSDDVSSVSQTHIESSQLQMSFPVLRDRLGVSASILPETSYNFSLSSQDSLSAVESPSGSTLRYDTETVASGGLNRIEIGVGYRVAPRTYIGIAPAFYFGTLSQRIDLSFDDDDFEPVNFSRNTSHTGWGGRVGFLQIIPGVINPTDILSVGISASLPVSLDAERRFETELDDGENVRLPNSKETRTVEYPLDLSAGLTYVLSDNFKVSSDVLYQNWSNYEPFEAQGNVTYIDRFRTGLGAEITGHNPNTPPSFFGDLIYRAGISYDSGSIEINDNRINTYRASVGIGIPTSDRSSSLNINFDYGVRGTQSDGLIREEIFELRVSFNLSELMFFRPRLR